MAQKIWITACTAAVFLASASPTMAQAVDPAFMAEFQRNCMDEVDAYVGVYPPGTKTRADAINEGTALGRSRATRAELERGLADETASLRRGNVGPNGVYSDAYTRVLICSYTAALSATSKREAAAQQQAAAAPPQQTQTRTVTTTRTLTGAEVQKALTDAQQRIAQAGALLNGAGDNRVALNAAKPRQKEEEKKKEEDKDAVEEVEGEAASNCLNLYQDNAGHAAGLHNRCGYKVHFAWCAYKPVKGTSAQYFNCDEFKAGSSGNDGAEGGADYGILVHQAKQILWLGCKTPSRPKDVEYRAGEVALYGACG